jgi:hypothetical protein
MYTLNEIQTFWRVLGERNKSALQKMLLDYIGQLLGIQQKDEKFDPNQIVSLVTQLRAFAAELVKDKKMERIFGVLPAEILVSGLNLKTMLLSEFKVTDSTTINDLKSLLTNAKQVPVNLKTGFEVRYIPSIKIAVDDKATNLEIATVSQVADFLTLCQKVADTQDFIRVIDFLELQTEDERRKTLGISVLMLKDEKIIDRYFHLLDILQAQGLKKEIYHMLTIRAMDQHTFGTFVMIANVSDKYLKLLDSLSEGNNAVPKEKIIELLKLDMIALPDNWKDIYNKKIQELAMPVQLAKPLSEPLMTTAVVTHELLQVPSISRQSTSDMESLLADSETDPDRSVTFILSPDVKNYSSARFNFDASQVTSAAVSPKNKAEKTTKTTAATPVETPGVMKRRKSF